MAMVRPLHKGGSVDDCNNYRPISLLSSISKVAERLAHAKVSDYVEENSIWCLLQAGFRSDHSTQSLFLHLTDAWYRSLDSGYLIGVVFLDISKAFDLVNHSALLSKLKHQFGFDGSSCEWFRSYLSDRCQVVHLNGDCSPSLSITFGVPQGSVFGPTLFTCYIRLAPKG